MTRTKKPDVTAAETSAAKPKSDPAPVSKPEPDPSTKAEGGADRDAGPTDSFSLFPAFDEAEAPQARRDSDHDFQCRRIPSLNGEPDDAACSLSEDRPEREEKPGPEKADPEGHRAEPAGSETAEDPDGDAGLPVAPTDDAATQEDPSAPAEVAAEPAVITEADADPDPAVDAPAQAGPAGSEPVPFDRAQRRRRAHGAAAEALRGGEEGGGAGRAVTRLLGSPPDVAAETAPSLPVGWLAIVEGPGRGTIFTLGQGLTHIGRGDGMGVRLNFGDGAVSRVNHASIVYDDERQVFFLGQGGKANMVRLNGRPVLTTEELGSGDQIRLGETTLRFIGLCGKDFDWSGGRPRRRGHAAAG